jgi:hypothetical protein
MPGCHKETPTRACGSIMAMARGPAQMAPCTALLAAARGHRGRDCAGIPGCRKSPIGGQTRRRERRAAVVEIMATVVVVIVVVSLSCRSQSWSWSWRWSRSRAAWHGSGGRCCCCSQGEEKKGGLTFCRVVGSAGACCRGCSSPPLLQTATLAGPSWAAVGASLCLRSCSRVRGSSRQWGREAWTAHQIKCALSRQRASGG